MPTKRPHWHIQTHHDEFVINHANGLPMDCQWIANGLPMIGGMGGVDIEGNPYGTDFHNTFDYSSSFDLNDRFSNSTWDKS